MNGIDPKLTFLQFNQYINNHDIDQLTGLIAPDYVFIPILGDTERGRDHAIEAWTSFFATYPDYRNHFQLITCRGDNVAAAGYSTCVYDPLNGPALWSAQITDARVSLWRIYLDTPENRDAVGLPQQSPQRMPVG